jgi:hypothetical protein
MEDSYRSRQVAGIAVSGGLLAFAVLALALFLVSDPQEERFTGEPSVDAIITAVAAEDVDYLVEHVTYQQTPCQIEPEPDPLTLLVPPECAPGVAELAPVEVIMNGTCQGVWVTSENVRQPFDERFSEPREVFAAVRMSEPFALTPAPYRIVFGRPGEPELPFSGHIGVLDGGVTQVSTWCGTVPEQIAAMVAAGGEVVYQHPDYEFPATVRGP